MFLAVRITLAAAALVIPAAADQVPRFEVEKHCRAVAAMTGRLGDPSDCLNDERSAREQLVRQWARFHPAGRARCLEQATLAGEPTYSALLTCIELEQDVRDLRQRQGRETTGQAGGMARY
jgi:hypothetical protein